MKALNPQKGSRMATAIASLILIGLAAVAQAQLIIDNGLPVDVPGYWAVDVTDGGESRNAWVTAVSPGGIGVSPGGIGIIPNSEIVFDYLSYVDVGKGGFQLSTKTTNSAAWVAANQVASSGQLTGSAGNPIQWSVVSSIMPGSPRMVSVFTFTASVGTLGKLRFSQYLDADVASNQFWDDDFFTRGSAAALNLELYTIDDADAYGASQSGGYGLPQGLVNTNFAGWAACQSAVIKSAIQNGAQPVSPAGVICSTLRSLAFNHPIVGPVYGQGDVTSVLTWEVSSTAKTAIIITTLSGVPVTPPPPARMNLKQANWVSYFAPATGSDSLSLSGYLPKGLDNYCDQPIQVDIWLLAAGQWVQTNVPGSLMADVPGAGPYSKCRFLSSAPGIKDLVFESVQLRAEKYVFMTLLVNNSFDWAAAVDGVLPSPPPAGSLYPLWIQVQTGSGLFWGTTTLKVCDASGSKVKLCAGPFQY